MKKFAGDIIILHVYPKSQSYDVRFLRYVVRQTKIFLPFYPPPNDPENKNFEKMKKMPENIIFLYIHM